MFSQREISIPGLITVRFYLARYFSNTLHYAVFQSISYMLPWQFREKQYICTVQNDKRLVFNTFYTLVF